MKIYKCSAFKENEGVVVSWHLTKTKAEKALKKIVAERTVAVVGPDGVTDFEIPLTRQGLVDWLNANVKK